MDQVYGLFCEIQLKNGTSTVGALEIGYYSDEGDHWLGIYLEDHNQFGNTLLFDGSQDSYELSRFNSLHKIKFINNYILLSTTQNTLDTNKRHLNKNYMEKEYYYKVASYLVDYISIYDELFSWDTIPTPPYHRINIDISEIKSIKLISQPSNTWLTEIDKYEQSAEQNICTGDNFPVWYHNLVDTICRKPIIDLSIGNYQ